MTTPVSTSSTDRGRLVTELTTRSPYQRTSRARGNFELWSWLFMRGSGVVLLDGALARTGSSAEAEWLKTLQRPGARDLVLAADELESFLERYYGEAGLPQITFPAGLELVIRSTPPERWVDVATNDVSGQGVALNVALRYESKEVPLLPLRPWSTRARIPAHGGRLL